MQCPACAAEVPDDDLFCENCGASLKAAAVGAGGCSCGAGPGETDEDGFCTRCGKRVLRPASDHVEEVLSADSAGVSDRGLRHDRNEDRFGMVQVGDGFALVVCDGVSTTRTSEVASQAVTTGVLESLEEVLHRGGVIEDAAQVVRAAIAAGAAALAEASPSDGSGDAPSTTVVAALVLKGEATIGWAGDSRAYWLQPPEIVALTRDHSWVNEMVASGRMSVEEAEKAPQAHAITRWIGADAGAEFEAEVVRFPVKTPGMLLLCTDGLWNYAPTPEEMAAVVGASGAEGADALEVVRRLVDFANGRGGQDNITAVLLRLEPAAQSNV